MSRSTIPSNTSHLIVRDRVNALTTDLHRIEDNAQVIYLEDSFVPPTGVTLDGSKAAPYNQIFNAIEAVVPGAGQASIIFAPGEYSYILGTIDLAANVSLISLHSRSAVVLETSIVTSNSNSEIHNITVGENYTMRFGDDQSNDVERVTFNSCNLGGIGQYRGGSTGNDLFSYLGCTFGHATEEKVQQFNGVGHFLTSCIFLPGCVIRVGNTNPTLVPSTLVSMTNVLITGESFIVTAEAGKSVQLTMALTQFVGNPMTFDVGLGGIVELSMDAFSYTQAVNSGTILNPLPPGVTLTVFDHPDNIPALP